MRAALIIDDPIFMQAKKFALEKGLTLRSLTSQALQEHMQRDLEPRGTERSSLQKDQRWIYDRGDDPKEIILSLDWENWKKQTTAYLEKFDFEKIRTK